MTHDGVVWLVPPESLTFVRQHWTSLQRDFPLRDGNTIMVGYDAAAVDGWGRMFTLRDYDCLAPGGFTPAEAVDPATLTAVKPFE